MTERGSRSSQVFRTLEVCAPNEQHPIGAHDRRVQQTDLVNAARQAVEIAHVTAMAWANRDFGDFHVVLFAWSF